jgi:predicted outer membrane lipoprotein
MIWRVLLAVLYACVFGILTALENFHPGMPDAPLLVVWLVAPVVGFLIGRWWVVFAVVGAIVGRAIGWDAGENDGNPAFWPPYVVTAIVFLGLPLLLGVVSSRAWRSRGQRTV